LGGRGEIDSQRSAPGQDGAFPEIWYRHTTKCLQRGPSAAGFPGSIFCPRQLIIVGDLFHSKANKELDLFKKWRNDLGHVKFHLVKGNHDILPDNWYDEAGITIDHEQLILKSFRFRHDSCTDSTIPDPSLYCFTGHVHPGISIRGLAKQSLHFPCFYFTDDHCVLPAFSRFTGTYSVQPQKGEHVFAIVDNSIIKIE
jgi:uncharacterized protein